jgi:hypothetical protein
MPTNLHDTLAVLGHLNRQPFTEQTCDRIAAAVRVAPVDAMEALRRLEHVGKVVSRVRVGRVVWSVPPERWTAR